MPRYDALCGAHLVSGHKNGLVAPPDEGRSWALYPLAILALSVERLSSLKFFVIITYTFKSMKS